MTKLEGVVNSVSLSTCRVSLVKLSLSLGSIITELLYYGYSYAWEIFVYVSEILNRNHVSVVFFLSFFLGGGGGGVWLSVSYILSPTQIFEKKNHKWFGSYSLPFYQFFFLQFSSFGNFLIMLWSCFAACA